MTSWKRRLRVFWRRSMRRSVSSHQLAGGVALGVALGVIAPYGTHLILAVLIASLLRYDRLAAMIGTFFNTPLTMAPIYYAGWKLGVFLNPTLNRKAVFPQDLSAHNFSGAVAALFQTAPQVLFSFLLGLFVLAVPLSLLTYFAVRKGIDVARSRKKHGSFRQVENHRAA